MQPFLGSRKFLALILFSGLLIVLLRLAAPAAQAQPARQGEATPTIETEPQKTPDLLLTPLPLESEGSENRSRPGALLATVTLLICGMVGMLVAGIGIAAIMIRLRTRNR